MMKETYERLAMDVTEFDTDDVIATSPPVFDPDNEWEMPVET